MNLTLTAMDATDEATRDEQGRLVRRRSGKLKFQPQGTIPAYGPGIDTEASGFVSAVDAYLADRFPPRAGESRVNLHWFGDEYSGSVTYSITDQELDATAYPRILAEGPPEQPGPTVATNADDEHGTASGTFRAKYHILPDGRLAISYEGTCRAVGMRFEPPQPPEVSRLGLVPIHQQEHQSSSKDANGREVFTTAWAKTCAESSGGEQTGSSNSNGTATHQAG